MNKSQASIKNKDNIKILRWEKLSPLTQEEAEARLHQEGYQSFCWYDVPGVIYPKHKHTDDECIWVLRGVIQFAIQDENYVMESGDRIYLPANTPHTATVPPSQGVTFLVGQKKIK